MAGNNIQYTIGFNANTSQAKSELASLQNTLKQISNMSIDLIDSGDIQDIQSASAAARELGSALEAATNKNTGKLDLSLFQKSIAKSGNDLNDLISRLSLAGNTGSKAFQQLAKSVTNAHMPIKQTSKLMNDFATTMKNTIKWQLSSNLVHGLQSGLQGAISYAKNLNSSLTDIRIVTGASADEMARFAKQANNAAKQLSTSTLDYTKASLIYYQQGDSEADVRKKAEITLKAANSSFNTSTQEMSEYLTAVWNSYQVGADELERYVDIMAALGAKTATSLEEIATSMQKVAATGNTVGVSMEQVSSIIATVSSVTRESAESIGTSYKTIFARLGDLKLGKTDEDGIGLGQVSSSLEKIGVSVLDASGDLRDMGDIITDLGNKWQTMSNAEKTAIAQVVAGKRQYTQLMALFENWDMYNQNLDIAANSDGALQEMQDIYAQSWEAASKRVQASMESIYSSVINDQTIISITNGIADLIDKVHSLADAFGGVGSVLGVISTIFMKQLKPQLAQGIGNFINNLKLSSGVAQKEFVQNQKNIMDEMTSNASLKDADQRILGYYDKLREAQSKVLLNGKTYTQEEIAQIESTIDKIKEKINVQTQLIELQKERSQTANSLANNLADTFVQSVAEDSLPDDQIWSDLSYSAQQEKLQSVRSAKPGEDSNFINERRAEINNLNFALEQLSSEQIDINIELDTEDEIIDLQNLQKAGVQSANDIINAFRMANKLIGKAQAAEDQLKNIKKQVNKNDQKNNDGTVTQVNMPEETKEAAKKFIKTVNNLGLDEALRKSLIDDVEKALAEADQGVEGAIDRLRNTLDQGIQATEEKLGTIRQNAREVSGYAEVVMGNNVSDQQKGDVRRAAQAEGRVEQNAQPMTEEEMGDSINTDFAAAQQSAENFANSLANVLDGVTSLASGIMTLKGGIEGLISGSATLGESLIAIASGAAMTFNGISLLINNIGVLKEAYVVLNSHLNDWIKSSVKNIQDIGKEIAARGGLVAAIKAKVVAHKQEAAAIREADAAQKAANASNPLGWILLAIAAITTLISLIGTYTESLKQKRAEASKNAEQELEAIQSRQEENKKELDEIQKTYNAYAELKKQYDETGENREDYESATQAILKALDLEALQVEATKGKYEELAKIIEYANEKRREEIRLSAESDLAQLTGYNKTWFEGLDDREGHNDKTLGTTEVRQQQNRQYYNSETNQYEQYSGATYRFGWALQHLRDSTLDDGGVGSVWGSSEDMYNSLIKLGFLANKKGKIIDTDDLDISSDPVQLMRTYQNMLAYQEDHSALKGNDQWNFVMETMASMVEPEIAARLNLGSINAEDKQENWQSYDDWRANQAEGTDTSKDAYFAAMEADVMESFTSLGLDPATAQSSVDTIIQSWVQGLSLDSDYADYQAREAKKKLYETDTWGDERLANDEVIERYNENNREIDLLEKAINAKRANPNSTETKSLIQALIDEGIITDENADLNSILSVKQRQIPSLMQSIDTVNAESANSVRTDLLSMAGINYDYEVSSGDILFNDTALIDFVAEKMSTYEDRFNNILQDEKYWDGEGLTMSGDASVANIARDVAYTLWGDELEAADSLQEKNEIIAKRLAEIDTITRQSLGLASDAVLTDRQRVEGYQMYMSAQKGSVTQARSLLAESYSPFNPTAATDQTKVTLEGFGEINVEDALGDFLSFDSLDKQSDIWKLSDKAFVSFIERLGEDYIGKTKEDFARMSSDEWDAMIAQAGKELIPLMEALSAEGVLTTEQISAVVQASVDTANKAHEAAQSAWEKIISLTSDEERSERAIIEKQEANESAQKWLEQGGSYDTLDAWTKYWLQESGITSNNFTQKALQDSQQALNIEREGLYSGIYTRGMTIMENAGEWDNILNGYRLNVQEDSEGKYRVVDGEGVIIESVELPADLIENLGLQTDIEGEGQFVIIDENMMNQLWSQTENASDQMHATEEFDMANPSVLNERQTYDYLKGLDSQFSALDAFEADASVENLLALRDALDMTNSSIAEYYNAIASAETAAEREAAIDNLTTAILNQNDAQLTNSESVELLLENYNKLYGITDEYGKTLTTAVLNQMKFSKQVSKSFKAIKSGQKPIKVLNKEYKTMTAALKDINAGAKKANQTFDDFVDEMQDISDADKEVYKTLNKMYGAFEELEDEIGDQNFGEDFLEQCMNAEEGTDIVGLAMDNIMSSLVDSDQFGSIFDGMANQFESGVLSFSDSAIAMINEAGLNVETCMNQMKAALEAAGGNWGSVDWGTLAHTMGVDMSWILGLLQQLLQAYVDANNIPGVDVSSLINAVQKAIGSAQQVHNMGGGSGVAKNANTQSSGGGGGGGGNKQKEDKLRFKDEIERYHVENQVLDRTAEKLDKISKLKERAYGKNYISQIDAETEALREQYEAQAALYNAANQYQAADRADLIGLGVGVQFDADGNISNYEDVMKALIDKYNAEVERYNNSEQGEGDKLRLDNAKEEYEDAKQAIENYEEAIQTANDALNEMEEIQNQISENALEKVTYELELNIEMNERDLELLELFKTRYEDTLHAQDELFGSLMSSATKYESNLAAIHQAYQKLTEQHAAGILNDADYAEGLTELSDQLVDTLSSLQDIKDEIAEVYSNTLEMAREEIEYATDALDHFNDTMQSYIDIAGLAGDMFFTIDGETITNSYKGLQTFYDAQYQNNIQRINIQKAHLDALLEEEAKFREKMESGEQLSDVERKRYEALAEQIRETRDELLSSTQESMEAIRAAYENTINAISEDLDNFLAGSATSIAHLADQYSYFQEEQSRYVSTAQELYEVSKLNRDIEESLQQATTEASKEALKALQEKINKQSELNELTEYDIQMNQLQYQLLLARIQLEEAQNAKDVVRLTRDENGNYAYRYTANQDKVNEAVQKYEDTLQQINDLTVQRTSEIENQMISAMQQYTQMFNEINTDYTLSTEERNAKLAELQERFSETMLYLQEQSNIATGNLTENQTAIASHYGVALSDITASTAGNVNANIQSMLENTEALIEAMNTAIFGEDGANTAWSELQERLGIVNAASGTAYADMINSAEDMAEMNIFAAQEALDTITVLEETIEPLGELTDAWDAHSTALEGVIDYYSNLTAEINNVIAALADLDNAGGVSSIPTVSEENNNTSSGSREFNTTSETDPEIVESFSENFNKFISGQELTEEEMSTMAEDFTSLMSYIDNLTAQIFSGAPSAQSAPSDNSTRSGENWEQQVIINAEFPNVVTQDEIIAAFMSLADKAQQLVNE